MADPIREAIHAWIREDVPLAGKMNLMPKHVEALIAKLAALRSPQGDGAEAMREACLKAALGACYGPPSSWPNDYPKCWRHPPSWGPDEKPSPTMAAWHDNGARDAWFAIRALPQHSLTKNQGGKP